MVYNRNDIDSIIHYALGLVGKSLREACIDTIIENSNTGKGNFGQMLEEHYFQYKPNSDSKADFYEVGLEVKSSPLKILNNKEYRSKERLVLNIINYFDVINQEFKTSSFFEKNAHLLLIFYLYEKGINILDLIIKIVGDWKFPESDLEIIKKDWELIKWKVNEGRAHELSEGDTFYLGACTKGGKGGNLRGQPKSDILAKQRAYSFKQGYLNHIIAKINKDTSAVYGKIIKNESDLRKKSFEEIVIDKYSKFFGKTVKEIINELALNTLNPNAKNYYHSISKAILGIKDNVDIEEFEKAGVTLKAIRIKENNKPKEDISFPAFKYTELVQEEWDNSTFIECLEHKFFFVFFKYEGDTLFLEKVKFWNMPFHDIEVSKLVWQDTIQVVLDGNIVARIVNGQRRTNFSGARDNKVAHVRPHTTDASHTFPLPTPDRLTGATEYTKHSFWLNKSYVSEEIYLK